MVTVELRKVLTPEGERDIKVQVEPFNRRKEAHTDFAFAFMDMLGRMPSEYKNMTEVARGYVETFMAHKAEHADDPNSDFACVLSDARACRTLFNNPVAQKQFSDFFANA